MILLTTSILLFRMGYRSGYGGYGGYGTVPYNFAGNYYNDWQRPYQPGYENNRYFGRNEYNMGYGGYGMSYYNRPIYNYNQGTDAHTGRRSPMLSTFTGGPYRGGYNRYYY